MVFFPLFHHFDWIYNTSCNVLLLVLPLHIVIMTRDMVKIYTFETQFPISISFFRIFSFHKSRCQASFFAYYRLFSFFFFSLSFATWSLCYPPDSPFNQLFHYQYACTYTVTCIQSMHQMVKRQINNRKYVFIARATFWIYT